ncbi:MAG: SUMF1/EgtB/PvdO family nonheme iron enzyme [Myxococcales bacterium]|nr:SUMF1/EgtB/PvdO family nonheme iron enzyme [Myxococcales bacterium]
MAPDSNWQCRSCGARNPVDATTCADCGALHVPASGAYDAMALLRDASLMRTTADATGLPAAASAPPVDRKQAAFASTAVMPPASMPASAPLPSLGVDDKAGIAPDKARSPEAQAPPISASPVGARSATRDSADGRAAVSRATMLLPAARMPIAESTVETGSVPVAMLANVSDPAQRRREIPAGRVLPVVMMSALGFVALLSVALWLRGSEVSAEYGGTAPPERPQPETGAPPETNIALQNPLVTLVAAPEFQAGLTEDNKETVLVLCNRVSENPNVECRRSYLQQLGEYPARPVAMPALQVHQQEVSNQQYQQCVQAGACSPQDWQACRFHSIYRYEFGRPVPDVMRQPDHPAVCVTFEQAHDFCASQGMMLPTVDEWERIARAGDDRLFPWGSHWAPGILNWGEYDMSAFPIPGRLDGHEFTAPAAAFDDGATPEGVYNMLGNAAEWVWLAERQANGTPVAAAEDGSGGAPGSPVGIRGGSYANHVLDMRLTRSVEIPAEQARSTVGFRCVRGVP